MDLRLPKTYSSIQCGMRGARNVEFDVGPFPGKKVSTTAENPLITLTVYWNDSCVNVFIDLQNQEHHDQFLPYQGLLAINITWKLQLHPDRASGREQRHGLTRIQFFIWDIATQDAEYPLINT